VSFVVHTVTMEQFFFSSEYLEFSMPLSLHQCSTHHLHLHLYPHFHCSHRKVNRTNPKHRLSQQCCLRYRGTLGTETTFTLAKGLQYTYMASMRKLATFRLQAWGVCVNTALIGLCVFTVCRSFVGISRRYGTYITHSI
jgi:hypothetical protein